ncbi:MAG: aminotransferase class V-fold PLP-dependent enzyme [Pseudohongiellaceae bacterium]
MNPIDQHIARLREETPGCQHRLHFNNAGTALSPMAVTGALLDHLALEQRFGGYEAAAEAQTSVDGFYHAFARLLNSETSEVAWAESASAAWNTLLHAIPLEAGDRIVTGRSEYAGNYLSLLHLARTRQVTIDVIDNRPDGTIDLDRLEAALDSDVRLIALTHVASQNGTVQPAEAVGRLARRHRILYLLDVAQSAGQLPLDVRSLGCDMLVGTGRKFLRGPRGTGFLYVRHDVTARLEPDRVDLHAARWLSDQQYRFHDDARRFESFERSVAGQIALGRAAAYAFELGLPAIRNRVVALAGRLRQSLSTIPGVAVHERLDANSGIVTFSQRNVSAADLHGQLLQRGINSSVARRCNTQLDFRRRGLEDINRASVHYYNTPEEVDTFCEAVERGS